MKKQNVIILVSIVAIVGFIAGYFVIRIQSTKGQKTVRVMRYSELRSLVTVLKRVEPTYPESALRDRVEGIVSLRVTTHFGLATSADVLRSVRDDLDSAAIAAVKLWRFAPLDADGKSTLGTAIVSIEFKLDTARSPK